jgi:F-type H+-transporting ATPase subunit epsilon
MADTGLELEIVTPEGVKLRTQVEELTAPSVEGQFGVLPGHRPMVAALSTGIVSYREKGVEQRVAVGIGYAQISHDRATIVTDRYCTKADVDAVRARLALKEADEALAAFEGDLGSADHTDRVREELWAAALLELYGDPPPPILRAFPEGRPPTDFVPPDAMANAETNEGSAPAARH